MAPQRLGSANAPTGTAIAPGMLSFVKYTVAPQVGQNRNVAWVPSSPVNTCSRAWPEIVTCAAENRAETANALLERRWQFGQ